MAIHFKNRAVIDESMIFGSASTNNRQSTEDVDRVSSGAVFSTVLTFRAWGNFSLPAWLVGPPRTGSL